MAEASPDELHSLALLSLQLQDKRLGVRVPVASANLALYIYMHVPIYHIYGYCDTDIEYIYVLSRLWFSWLAKVGAAGLVRDVHSLHGHAKEEVD